MTEHKPSHTRADHIDQLRGLAVFGMIIAHSIYFFHNGESEVLIGLARALNTVVLTFFVFIAGLAASRTLDTTGHISARHLMWPIFKRAGLLYITYAILSLINIISQDVTLSIFEISQKILAALTFQAPPSFTEFLPLFMIITVFFVPLRMIYRISRKSLWVTLCTSIGIYLVGLLLFAASVPEYLIGTKALLVGHTSLLRFPLLSYLPIYFLGLWWQYQNDHNNAHYLLRQKSGIFIGSGIIVFVGIILNTSYDVSIISPLTRWPPSIGFLAAGLLWSISSHLLLPVLNALPRMKKTINYVGRDALDMLMHHLLLLFLYRQLFGTQFGTILQVLGASAVVIVATILLSSLSFTNNISFPIHIETHRKTKLRKRYLLLGALLSLFVLWNMLIPSHVSPYGNVLTKKSTKTTVTLPKTATLYISTNRTWYSPQMTGANTIELSVEVIDTATNTPIALPSDVFTIYSGDNEIPLSGFAQNNGVIVFIISTKDLPIGTHTLSAKIRSNSSPQKISNTVRVHVTNPLLVAWTFDWEGWKPMQNALSRIEDFGNTYTPIQFTHFVHPRTFEDGVMSSEEIAIVQNFLKNRQLLGDEIALHMHMQFDFVRAAGITPRRTNAWGLRSNEGYDIPTTEYSPDEFRSILRFATEQLSRAGFTNIKGFRAGGWYINAQQLDMLKNAGFTYDSSGRSKPASGAFQNTPWKLPTDAQPYFLDKTDQNITTSENGLLEIPNNALTTYELSIEELIALAKMAYTGSPLPQSKTLIYVSHPQFYDREFEKIPPVLDYLHSVSLERDSGPIVFSTMSDIAKLWISN